MATSSENSQNVGKAPCTTVLPERESAFTQQIRDIGQTLLVTFWLILLFFLCDICVEHIFQPQIFFYAALKCLAAFFLVSLAVLYIFRIKFNLNFKKIFYSEIIFLLFSYSFIMTFPVTIDRSFSVYMLGAISSSEKVGHALGLEELSDVTRAYFFNNRMLQRRINEQIATGTITIDKRNQVTLTNRGKFIVRIYRTIGFLFDLDKKNYAPEVNWSESEDYSHSSP